ncbi:MAG: glycosyltransferase family 4 protein, partial [Okeania sp. SIO3C4]|nr:glycosyltransferase family 4 protein [Okeania sp. SIO3C4]
MTIPSFRTLFIVSQLPYPAMAGSPLRNWQNINIIKKYGEVAVFSFSGENPQNKTIPGINYWHNYNVNHRGNFSEKLAKKLLRLSPWRYPLFDEVYAKVAVRELNKIMANFQPDLVVISQLTHCRYLPIIKSYKCQIIFDEHDIVADVFKQNFRLLNSFKTQLQAKLQLLYIQSKERNLLRKANQVWVCSEQDSKLLQNLYRTEIKPHIIPNGINIAEYENVKNGKCSPPKELKLNPQTLIFIGTYGYQPNINAR